MRAGDEKGFTLIELLVALAILGVIVVICGRIFEQSNVAWNTGTRKAEVNMVGRGLADFIAQDISRAVLVTDLDDLARSNQVYSSTLKFWILDEAGVSAAEPHALLEIEYNLGQVKRSGVALAPSDLVDSIRVSTRSGYVDVDVSVKEVGSSDTVPFKSRAWLVNRNRYKYDQ